MCKGTGREIYHVSPEALIDVYGGEDWANEYVRPCTKCGGKVVGEEDLTNVPDMYREADISKFDFSIYKKDTQFIKKVISSMLDKYRTKNESSWEGQGMGLYIYSKTPGSGKTFLACCIGKSIMIKYNLRMKFITAPDYIEKVSESYKREKGELDPTRIYKECELLILDDIGAQKSGEWQDQELFRLINERHVKSLPTIFTSNMSIQALNIDERTKSRIQKKTIPIAMPEESIRQQKAEDEQARFIRNMCM